MITVRVIRTGATDRVLAAREGDDLLEVIQSAGIPITTACGGVASCGQCRVDVVAGGDQLSTPRPHEAVHLEGHSTARLACQARARPCARGVECQASEIVVRLPGPDAE